MNISHPEPIATPRSTPMEREEEATRQEPSEEATLFLEEQIADLAPAAGKLGFWRSVSSGLPVVCAQDDALWEILPDGTRRFVKSLEAERDIAAGTQFEIL